MKVIIGHNLSLRRVNVSCILRNPMEVFFSHFLRSLDQFQSCQPTDSMPDSVTASAGCIVAEISGRGGSSIGAKAFP